MGFGHAQRPRAVVLDLWSMVGSKSFFQIQKQNHVITAHFFM